MKPTEWIVRRVLNNGIGMGKCEVCGDNSVEYSCIHKKQRPPQGEELTILYDFVTFVCGDCLHETINTPLEQLKNGDK